MKGIETKYLLEIILVAIIIITLVIIAVNPSIVFGKSSGDQISFREFCFHWSILGYPTNNDTISIDREGGGPPFVYSVDDYCSKAGATDRNTCVTICKGAA